MPAHLYITITVDWEGETLDEADLAEMSAFPPNVPATHFFCPAYFARQNAEMKGKLQDRLLTSKAIRENDEVGLHIHAWKSLTDGAGVAYRNEPDWEDKSQSATYDDRADTGVSVPLGAYGKEEISALITSSIDLIQKHVRNQPIQSFRCGGWMSNDVVLEALGERNLIDASAIPVSYLQNTQDIEKAFTNAQKLRNWNMVLWGQAGDQQQRSWLANQHMRGVYPQGIQSKLSYRGDEPISQPQWIPLPNGTKVLEVPDTAILADYISRSAMQAHITAALETAQSEQKPMFISLGYHQEKCRLVEDIFDKKTDLSYVGKIKSMIELIKQRAGDEKIPFTFLKVSEVKALVEQAQ